MRDAALGEVLGDEFLIVKRVPQVNGLRTRDRQIEDNIGSASPVLRSASRRPPRARRRAQRFSGSNLRTSLATAKTFRGSGDNLVP